jgi:hypothetical protein
MVAPRVFRWSLAVLRKAARPHVEAEASSRLRAHFPSATLAVGQEGPGEPPPSLPLAM